MQHWSQLDVGGGPRPRGRLSHAAVCLGYGGHHPQLLVTGGWGGGVTLSDAWVLDIVFRRWREVRVCEC